MPLYFLYINSVLLLIRDMPPKHPKRKIQIENRPITSYADLDSPNVDLPSTSSTLDDTRHTLRQSGLTFYNSRLTCTKHTTFVDSGYVTTQQRNTPTCISRTKRNKAHNTQKNDAHTDDIKNYFQKNPDKKKPTTKCATVVNRTYDPHGSRSSDGTGTNGGSGMRRDDTNEGLYEYTIPEASGFHCDAELTPNVLGHGTADRGEGRWQQ